MKGGYRYRYTYAAKINHRQIKRKMWIFLPDQMMLCCHPLPCQRLEDGQHGNGNYHHKMVQ